MKSNCLFLEVSLNGHVLEWINHLYNFVNNADRNYYLVLPRTFQTKKDLLKWNKTNYIHIYFLSKEEESLCNTGSPLRCAWECTKVLRKYIRLTHANIVFQTFLMRTQPFLSFLIPSKVAVVGVVYRIYLYDDDITFLKKCAEKLRYFILARSKSIRCVFMLNDKFAASYFNKQYRTDKFTYLPDPINNITHTNNNLREKFGISDNKMIYFQFGSLDERKSTMTILNAIKLMKSDELKDKCFIFSGRISSTIKREFDSVIYDLLKKVQIIVLDGFIPYSQLNDLCYTCDHIFILYTNHTQSSGALGYASFFKKNVIGTSHGLLGRLIKDYELGQTIDVLDANHIKDAILNANSNYKVNNYVESHNVATFCNTIFDYL